MIEFDSKRKIFHLHNDEFSYFFSINKLGYLIHLYSGKRINEIDIERLTERYAERYAYLDNNEEVCDESYYFALQASNFECAPHLTGDKRGAPIIIKNVDKSTLTDFRYYSHEIIYGKNEIENLPHARIEKAKNVETLIVTCKDIRSEVYIKLYYSIFDDLNVLLRNCEVFNNESEDISLLKASSIELDLFGDEYTLISTHGTWSMDRLVEETPINHNKIEVADSHGARGFYHNPSIIVKQNEATLHNGIAFGFSLIYSGNFSYEIGEDDLNQTRIIGGINPETFEFKLSKGEKIITPECVLAFSENGINGVTKTLHDFARSYIIPKKFVNAERPILINSWEAYYFDFDTAKIKKLIDEAKNLGIEMVVLDDGWFGKRDDDKTSLGDWDVNVEKINLAEVIKYAHDSKMKFGLWVEPEMISINSSLYNEHPEYALYNRNVKPTLYRHQLVLDLTNDKVVDAIFTKISKIFETYDIDYCKWDFNRYLSEIGSTNLPNDREGEIYHRFMLGTYKLLNKFTKKFPNILLETCASGGGRFDLGMLYYSPQIWASDETDPNARVEIQYATNMFYPLSSIGAHVSERPFSTYQDKAIIAAFGTFGYELDPLKLKDEDKKQIIEINKLVKTWHHIVTIGDYYALKDPTKSNYASWICVTKNKKEALVFHYNFRREPTRARYIKLVGLIEDQYYFNSLTNKIYRGDFYMNVGLNISCPIDEGKAMMFVIKAVSLLEKTLYEKMNSGKEEKRDKIL